MNTGAVKHCKAAAKGYEALAEAFQQLNNLAKLKAQVNAGVDTWTEVRLHGTEGLAFSIRLPT